MRLVVGGAWVACVGLGVVLLTGAAHGQDQPAMSQEQVKALFATSCGFCHLAGGRAKGKGPQLMNTSRSDEYLINRIATGKPGRMPAFGGAFTMEQIEAIIRYIRDLKPES